MARYFFLLTLTWSACLQAQQLPQSGQQFGLDTIPVPNQVAYITNNFGLIHAKGFEEAINLSNYALEVSQQNNWHIETGLSLMCLGVAYYLRGHYDKALPAFLRSSDIFDSIQYNSGIARVNNELAVFYRKQGELDKMNQCLDKSEAAAKAAGNLEALGTSYHHRGVALYKKGLEKEAMIFFQKVLDIRIETKDSVGLGYIYLDFAQHETSLNNTEKAIGYVEKSSAIRKKIGDLQGLAVNETTKGEIYMAAREYQRAIPYFKKSIELATPIAFTDLIRYAHDMMQKCYLETGDYKNAYTSLNTSVAFKDSLISVEKTRAIQELQTKYETEKKEQQIALQLAEIKNSRLLSATLAGIVVFLLIIGALYRNRVLLKQAKILEEEKTKLREAQIEAALSSQESERKRFARDLHDGFGQFISVLNLNLKSLEKNDADRQAIFENSSQVLDEMYREIKSICFNLMPETLIKKGIVDAIKEFALRVNRPGKIHLEVDTFGMEERLSDLQEISLYRITQEWVNNVIKYSDADRITLSLTRDEEEITLLIEDNGSGFDKTQLTQGKGNGWKNLNSRTNLIKGELELDTTVGCKGSTLIMNAPASINTVTNQVNVI